MKKLASVILCMALAMGMAACTSTPEETTSTQTSVEAGETHDTINVDTSTASGKVFDAFTKKVSEEPDIEKVAEAIGTEDITGYNCAYMQVEEGYLNGFSSEIKGFKKGVMFSPVIGSIPFVAYIFETDDAEALKASLLGAADPRWNICTEADETLCEVYDGYVFFIMCPKAE